MKRRTKAMTLLLLGITLYGPTGYAADQNGGETPARRAWTQAERKKGYVVFSHGAMRRLPSSYVPTDKEVVEEVSIELAQGEYESIQFGVHALAPDIRDVRLDVRIGVDCQVYHRANHQTTQNRLSPHSDYARTLPHEVVLERGDLVTSVAQDSSANVWLTFHATPQTAPGVHVGVISVQPRDRPATQLKLILRIRPFLLRQPRIAFGMYHPALWGYPAYGADQAQKAAFTDMMKHGQTSIMFYEGQDLIPPPKSRLWDRDLPQAMQAGLTRRDIPCFVLSSNITDTSDGREPAKRADQARLTAVWLADECRRRGWPELILYGRDEPGYPAVGLRENYEYLRDIPIRIGTAMDAQAAYGYGDIHDVWIIEEDQLTSQMSSEARRLGAEVWSYSFRIAREEFNPVRQRFYAGLFTWAHGLSGNTVWAYQHGNHSHVWYRLDEHEPMPMQVWEMRREGIDDYRYLQMLDDAVAAKRGDPLAAEADGWLTTLRNRLVGINPTEVEADHPLSEAEYDAIRTRAAGYIERLGPVPPPPVAPQPGARLKDEAAPLRDSSLRDCITALEDPDPFLRRSAAAALLERGPDAAEAVPALTRKLTDPDVRIVSLRALEAIGPAAVESLDEVARVYEHPDGFVRVAATFCLAAMGPPAAEALRTALKDKDYPPNVQAAGRALARLGDAAIVALPEVMEHLLDHSNFKVSYAGTCIVAALGPAAAGAVDKLVKVYVEKRGRAPDELRALASIGPAARSAVPALLEYGPTSGLYVYEMHYALYRIRGEQGDLDALLVLLRDPTSQKTNPIPKSLHSSVQMDVATRLEAMGVKAQAAVPEVRRLIESQAVPEPVRVKLSAFLKRVENGEGFRAVMP